MAPSHKLPESHTFTAWRAGRFPPVLEVSVHLTPKKYVFYYCNCRHNNTSFQTFCILSLLKILSTGPRRQGRKLQPPLIDAQGWGGCLADLFTISGMDESEASLLSKPMAWFSASSPVRPGDDIPISKSSQCCFARTVWPGGAVAVLTGVFRDRSVPKSRGSSKHLQTFLTVPGFPQSRETSILKVISQKNLFASKISSFFTRTQKERGPCDLNRRQPECQGIQSDFLPSLRDHTSDSMA